MNATRAKPASPLAKNAFSPNQSGKLGTGQTNFEIGSASSRFYRLSATPGDANND
jgi:hypothetical protein